MRTILDKAETKEIKDLLPNSGANVQSLNELKFLRNFSGDVKDKYLLQVQKDHSNLSPGLKLVEELINFIRATVEVDEARRDRNFQTLVGVFGVGLAAGSAAASLVGNFPHFDPAKDKLEALDNYWLDSFVSKWLHVSDPWLVSATLGAYCLIITLIASVIAALTIELWGRATRVKKRSP